MRLVRDLRLLKQMLPVMRAMRKLSPTGLDTVASEIETVADRYPESPALITDEATWSYRKLDIQANRYAHFYLARGLTVGDAIAVDMANGLHYVAAWLGAAKVGVTAALINTNLFGAQLSHCLKLADPKLIVLSNARVPAFATVTHEFDTMPVYVVGGNIEPELAAARSDRPADVHRRGATSGGTDAFVIYTSGTTGLPKAAHFSHFRVVSMAHAVAKALKLGPGDRQYCCLPLYHSAGSIGAVCGSLLSGSAAIIVPKFSAREFFPDLVRFEATSFYYVGELFRYLVNQNPVPQERTHRVTRCAGNGLRPDIWPTVQQRFRIPRILEGYGSTEGNVALINLEAKQGSVGRYPSFVRKALGIELIRYDVEADQPVRDRHGHCIRCVPGEPGEVIGKIANNTDAPTGRFEGYFDAEATERKVLRNVFRPGDAYFRSGDLLRMDREGFFYFVDRIGDTFRWKGENVATTEVAEVISVLSGIEDVNVYGVAVPGAEGRAGMAAVVPRKGEPLDLDALYKATERDLAPYARPLFLRIQQEMDVTGTFKQRKVHLVQQGFDPALVGADLYFRDTRAGTYVPLTGPLYDGICSGAIRT
ncbi:long-chain-acyl-CoA synthetase [Mycobacteroides abscessus]|uniref:long-chain-acyl-CoA synthetase n=1 Tax=Mycobacteroides abscessus TaxID=36809 RepID=UPI0009CE87F4|nr:long-chain-acyl-CoA synthetase [Mycobacteroides abscessus]SLG56437.1 Probable fatty-acid-CoA ligase FadD [Mycobacteroides abscessus subsp. abscessus]